MTSLETAWWAVDGCGRCLAELTHDQEVQGSIPETTKLGRRTLSKIAWASANTEKNNICYDTLTGLNKHSHVATKLPF